MSPIVRQRESGGKSIVANVVDNSLSEMEPTWLSSPPPPPLRFSSYSLLEGGDTAAGSLGLPTGVLFSPFSRLAPPPPRIPRQPILCTYCLAYPSPFCRVDSATGSWRCCFCGKNNPCYAEDFIGSSPSEHRESYPEMTYKAVEYAEEDLTGVLLSGMSSMSLATGPHRKRDKAASAPGHVFVVDGNMRGHALADLARSVDQVLGTMEPEALVSLVVFTGVVSVYRLGQAGAGAALAEVFPGAETLQEEEVDRRLSKGDRDHFLPVRAGRGALVKVLKILRGVGDDQGQLDPRSSNGRDSHGTNNGAATVRRRPWGSRRVPVPEHRRRRCLGAAVEYAIRLARLAGRPTTRLLVFLGGCPNFGPGAVAPCVAGAAAAEVEPEALSAATDYFQKLGNRALKQGTGVDVFCGGSEALGAAALQGLVAPTGGYVVIQPSFGVDFAANLAKSIGEQSMSDGDGLHGCVMDVRTSSDVELLHVIGPADSTDDYNTVDREAESASAAAAKTAEVGLPGLLGVMENKAGGLGRRNNNSGGDGDVNGKGSSFHRLLIGRVDPRTTMAMYFDGPSKSTSSLFKKKRRSRAGDSGEDDQGLDDEEIEHVFFQFVIRRATPGGDGRVTRVVTHRLPVTDDDEGFLKTVDPEALAVLVAKEAVLRATFGTESGTNELEVEEARFAVDTVVEEVSVRFRDLRKILASSSSLIEANTNSSRRGSNGGGRGRVRQSQSVSSDTSHTVIRQDSGSSLLDAEGGQAGGFELEPSAEPEIGDGCVGGDVREEEEDDRGGLEGPEDLVFPKELGGLPRQLFHLRRGPLLGPLLQNSDDPLCLRHLFLRGTLEDCLRMMAPEMFSLKAAESLPILADTGESNGSMEPNQDDQASVLPFSSVPVETLAMLADRILVLDTHDRIFVWSGEDVCGQEFDAVRKACERKFSYEGATRFPAPRMVFLKDGTSWSRYLTSRLIPSHKDPVEDQIRGFPELTGVPPAEMERLRMKLPLTDDESYREFFWDVCDSGSSKSW